MRVPGLIGFGGGMGGGNPNPMVWHESEVPLDKDLTQSPWSRSGDAIRAQPLRGMAVRSTDLHCNSDITVQTDPASPCERPAQDVPELSAARADEHRWS